MTGHELHDISTIQGSISLQLRYNLIIPQKSLMKLYNIKIISHRFT